MRGGLRLRNGNAAPAAAIHTAGRRSRCGGHQSHARASPPAGNGRPSATGAGQCLQALCLGHRRHNRPHHGSHPKQGHALRSLRQQPPERNKKSATRDRTRDAGPARCSKRGWGIGRRGLDGPERPALFYNHSPHVRIPIRIIGRAVAKALLALALALASEIPPSRSNAAAAANTSAW